ncbi:radical SAM family protein [Streptomyces tendae]|uniref:hypothetical protein n=1 Tax=Streptomyces tendae TaxID=1932 RepID=UPI00369FA514
MVSTTSSLGETLPVLGATRHGADGTVGAALLSSAGVVEATYFKVDQDAAIARGRLDRERVCISCTGGGCGMGCVTFCETGQNAPTGQCTVADMLGQVLAIREIVAAERATAGERDSLPPWGVTFAGMGEPGTNLAAVIPAIETFLSPDWSSVVDQVSLSTIGLVDKMRELTRAMRRRKLPLRLYYSAHGFGNRTDIIPMNAHHPLREGLVALHEHARYTVGEFGIKAAVSYLLLHGVNDDIAIVDQLAEELDPAYIDVQILMKNRTEHTPDLRTDDATADRWAARFAELGFRSWVTRSSGRDEDTRVGCGQMSAAHGGDHVAVSGRRLLPVSWPAAGAAG